MSHKPGGRLPLLSARPADILATLKRAATSSAAQRHDVCVNSLPKTVTRQRRGCVNPSPSAPESSTLTTACKNIETFSYTRRVDCRYRVVDSTQWSSLSDITADTTTLVDNNNSAARSLDSGSVVVHCPGGNSGSGARPAAPGSTRSSVLFHTHFTNNTTDVQVLDRLRREYCSALALSLLPSVR